MRYIRTYLYLFRRVDRGEREREGKDKGKGKGRVG